MTTPKLQTALAALERVSKGEGVETMNAEQLTNYAKEQLSKADADEDGGKARIDALTETVNAAVDTFKADPTAEVEVVVFVEPPAPDSNPALAKRMDSIESSLTEIKALLKQDNDAENPKTETVDVPPVPEGHDGGTISTNQPQGDLNGPRGEETKSTDGDAPGEGDDEAKADDAKEGEAKADDAKEGDDEAKAADAKEGDGDEVEKSDDEPFVWPADLNSESYVDAQRKGLAKREEVDALRPDWGYDNEAAPTG